MNDISSIISGLVGVIAGSEYEQQITTKLEAILSKKENETDTILSSGANEFRVSSVAKSWDYSFNRYQNRPLAYVNDMGNNQVAVIDIKRGVKVTDIPVGHGPTGIDISPDRRFVYTANSIDATLSVIRTADNKVVNTIQLNNFPYESSSPAGVKVSPDGRYIYVANRDTDNISVVDSCLCQVVTDVPLPGGCHPLIIDITPDGNLAYVTLMLSGQVGVIDLNTNLLVKLIDLENSSPVGIDIAKHKPLALVSRQTDSSLSMINTDLAETSPNLIGVANHPFGLILSPAADLVYTACQGEQTVSIVDLFMHAEIENIQAGNTPAWLGLARDGKLLIVSDVLAGTVTIVNTRNYEITGMVNLNSVLQLVAIKD